MESVTSPAKCVPCHPCHHSLVWWRVEPLHCNYTFISPSQAASRLSPPPTLSVPSLLCPIAPSPLLSYVCIASPHSPAISISTWRGQNTCLIPSNTPKPFFFSFQFREINKRQRQELEWDWVGAGLECLRWELRLGEKKQHEIVWNVRGGWWECELGGRWGFSGWRKRGWTERLANDILIWHTQGQTCRSVWEAENCSLPVLWNTWVG